jgi:hypothetical protein
LDGTGGGATIRSTIKFPPNRAIDFAMTVAQPLNDDSSSWFCGGFQRMDDFANAQPWILWISREPLTVWPEFWDEQGFEWEGNKTSVDPWQEHVYGIERYERRDVFLRDGKEFDEVEWVDDYTPSLQIRFSAYNGSVIHVRWVRVREVCYPAPAVTLGSMESF